MKKFSALLLAVVMGIFCLAGCGQTASSSAAGTSDSGNTSETATGDKVHLTWRVAEPQFESQFQEVAEAFNAQSDTIEVEIVMLSDDAVFKTKINSGEMYDMFNMNSYANVKMYSEYLMDLTDAPFVKNIQDFAYPAADVDGKLLGVPLDFNSYGLIYNKDIFESVGITELPETVDELRAACETLKANGVTPFATGFKDSWIIGHIFSHFMSTQPSYDTIAGYDKLAAGEESFADLPHTQYLFDFLNLMVEYGLGTDLDLGWQEIETAFANGEVAMIQMGVWCEDYLLEVNPELQMGLMPIPVGNEADKCGVDSDISWVVGVYNKGENQEACLEFLDWLVNSKQGKRLRPT